MDAYDDNTNHPQPTEPTPHHRRKWIDTPLQMLNARAFQLIF